MKQKNTKISSIHKSSHTAISTSVLAILLVIILLLISGCSTKKVEVSETTATDQLLMPAYVINPMALRAADKVLSIKGYGATGAVTDKDLTIHDMLVYAVQDEYLARVLYSGIVEKFGAQRPYINIRSAEDMHLAALKKLFDAYRFDFPADDAAKHGMKPTDMKDAAQMSVDKEIANIAMYKLFLQHELPNDIKDVFIMLKKASENHLKAFLRQIDRFYQSSSTVTEPLKPVRYLDLRN